MQSTEAPRAAAKLVVGAKKAAEVAEQVRVLKPFHALLRNNHYRSSVSVRIKPYYVRERERRRLERAPEGDQAPASLEGSGASED